MTFLQPWALLALPAVALPIIIHLIHQRRFQTVPWAAMMFLLEARALAQGYSRLRHWLIMALRVLAVGAIIVAVGRPLSRGWLALAGGGRPDTAIVLLDRSPSMQARGPDAAETKLETARRQMAQTLATLAATRSFVVAGPGPAVELATPQALVDLPTLGPAAAASDLPRMLQAAYDTIQSNAAGATEIWICSDQRHNDWAADDGSWTGLRDAFARLPQPVRFQLLAFPDLEPENLAVRVTAARLVRNGSASELDLSVAIVRPADGPARRVPVTFEIGGAATTVEVELVGREAVLAGHVVPLEADATQAFGRVTIPADADAADNDFYFAAAEPGPRRTLVVGDESAARTALELVAAIPPDRAATADVTVVPMATLAAAAWEETSLVIWMAPLPEGEASDLVQRFVDRGGQVLFVPPETPDATTFAGIGWREWTDHEPPLAPASWRTEDDLLANTLAGAALPVGDLAIRRSCGLAGEFVPLATLPDDVPLVVRAPGQRGVYFLTTLPQARDSSLASEGIVLYALVQRAIDHGGEPLSRARQVEAGPDALLAVAGTSRQVAGPDSAALEPGLHAGVFVAGERVVAVNRPAAEDAGRPLDDARIDGLFAGLPLRRIEGVAGRDGSLVQEIWRAFLVATVLALIGEGLLGMPTRRRAAVAGPRLEAAA